MIDKECKTEEFCCKRRGYTMTDMERPELSEKELMHLLATDLDAHFDALYEKYEKLLYRLVYRMLFDGKRTDSKDEATDVVQRTMIKAYYALKGFPRERIEDMKLLAWLKAIAINDAKRSLRPTKVDVESQLLTKDGRSVFENIQDDLGLMPETLIERAELIEQIEQAILSLPPRYKEVMIQYYIEDRKEEDIARELGRPLNTIKSQIRRARILLQARLKPLREEGR